MPKISTVATGAAIAGLGFIGALGLLYWARKNDIQPLAEWTETFQGL